MKRLLCLSLCFTLANASDDSQAAELQRIASRQKLVPLKLFDEILNECATADSKRDPALKQSSQAVLDGCMRELHGIENFSNQRTVLIYSLEDTEKKRDNASAHLIKDILATVQQGDETTFERTCEDVETSMKRLARMGWCAYVLGNDTDAEAYWSVACEGSDEAKQGLTTLEFDYAVNYFNLGKKQDGLRLAQLIKKEHFNYLNQSQQTQLKELIAQHQTDDAAQ